jgi:hypothetical protein
VELACPHGTHSPKIDDAATRAITLLRNLELEDQFPQADFPLQIVRSGLSIFTARGTTKKGREYTHGLALSQSEPCNPLLFPGNCNLLSVLLNTE